MLACTRELNFHFLDLLFSRTLFGPQNDPKIDPKMTPKFTMFASFLTPGPLPEPPGAILDALRALRELFGSSLGALGALLSPQEGPKRAQEGPKRAQEGPKSPNLSQNCPKVVPKSPKIYSKCSKIVRLGSNFCQPIYLDALFLNMMSVCPDSLISDRFRAKNGHRKTKMLHTKKLKN